jgi:UDP-N-acetylglucosamine acyltransferase
MNEIHPSAVIGPDVELGDGNVIGPFVVISGRVLIGDRNWIGAGAVLGAPPEVRSFIHPSVYRGDPSPGVRIGSDNVIREHAQIHQGTHSPTSIGDGCFLMNQIYVAHDGTVGEAVTLASSVLLAGHVTIEARANLGMGAKVHQFRRVGAGAMVGMGSVVTRDIPPFAKVYGSPSRVHGVNRIGLERLGASARVVDAIDAEYRAGRVPALEQIDLPDGIARLISNSD